MVDFGASTICGPDGTQLCKCQYLYFCTSKASKLSRKLSTWRILELGEVGYHRDGLHCFAETHLVGEDARDAVVV